MAIPISIVTYIFVTKGCYTWYYVAEDDINEQPRTGARRLHKYLCHKN